MPDVFLSYSREDQAVARRFADAFRDAGLSVWWDQALSPGEAFDAVTEKALEEARAVIVLWSKASVGSRWVRAEATQANSSGKLVPVMIEPCKRPIMFELTHTVDLAGWTGNGEAPGFRALLERVRTLAGQTSGSAASSASEARPPSTGSSWRPAYTLLFVALTLVAGVTLLWMNTRTGTSSAPPPGTQQNAATPITIAVLPFANLSSDPEQEYFSDGLTEELLNELAQNRSLSVTGRTSSFSFKGKNEDLREIGRKLGVAQLLEGSVRKQGGQVRITAQLIDAGTGVHQWSKTYDGSLEDSFALQEQVARDVAQALSVTLDVGPIRSAQGGTRNAEAYDLYLRALPLEKRDGREDNRRASELLQQAVALDPLFARAWALRFNITTKQIGLDPEDPQVLRERSIAQQRVLELAPDSLPGKEIRARQLMAEHKWAEAEGVMRSADVPETVGPLTGVMISVGRVNEALILFEEWSRIDPLALLNSTSYQMLLDLAGKPERAQAEYLRSKELEGAHGRADFYALIRALDTREHDMAAAEAQFDVLLGNLEPGPRMDIMRPLRASLRDPATARRLIRQTIVDPAYQDMTSQISLMHFADRFDDRESALRALGNIAKSRQAVAFHYAHWLPSRTAFRSDPRFKQIVRDLGLVDYWRTTGNWGDFCRPVGNEDFECR